MSTPAPIDATTTAPDEDRTISLARARAEAYVWGFQNSHDPACLDTAIAAEFASAYAGLVAEFLAGHRAFLTPIPHAWQTWCAGVDLDNPAPQPYRLAHPVTDEQYAAAAQDPAALELGREAIGYARGWCDRAGIGSGLAVAFARACTVLAASQRSRPDVGRLWSNMLRGQPLDSFT